MGYPPDPLGTGLMQKGAVVPAHQVLCLKENCPQGLRVQMPADALYQEDQRDGVGALELGRQGRFLLRGETRSGQPCGRAGQQGHELQSVEIPHRVPLSGGIPHGAAGGLNGTPLGDAALYVEGTAVTKPPQFGQRFAHRGQGDAVGFGEFGFMGKILFQRIDAGVDLGDKILCDLDIDRIASIQTFPLKGLRRGKRYVPVLRLQPTERHPNGVRSAQITGSQPVVFFLDVPVFQGREKIPIPVHLREKWGVVTRKEKRQVAIPVKAGIDFRKQRVSARLKQFPAQPGHKAPLVGLYAPVHGPLRLFITGQETHITCLGGKG